MAVSQIQSRTQVLPTKEDFKKLLDAKTNYEAHKTAADRDAWNKAHFKETPWGIAWKVSVDPRAKCASSDIALRYFIAAVSIDWQDLITQLKRTLQKWGLDSADLTTIANLYWRTEAGLQDIGKALGEAQQEEAKVEESLALAEAVEKHNSLNPKLFTKEETLKDKVRDKMLEIVDEFLADLREQDIKIKVDDILFIGSNASYNYNKDSDIDLHILTNVKATKYSSEVADALYSAYRSLFNKNLDIEFFGIPLEIFVETENSSRVSNGIYSVKKNNWIKKPVAEDIPDYDINALDKLVDDWENKCKDLINDIKADKLNNEDKVIKMLEDIYDKLRKKGITKGEYSVENLAFKELRNKGYLDKLKDYKNELISKRLSLEERLDNQTRMEIYNQISRAVGTHPIIQDNGVFFIYNIKPSEINSRVMALKKLPFIEEVHAQENGKYDFSNTLEIAMNKMPSKYYDIRGKIKN